MKLLQEIACQRTLSKALKRKLGVSRLGEEQMSCWLVSKKVTIPLFPYERRQGKTSHYVCYCTKCCIFWRNSCWDSCFPRIAGVESCLCMSVVYLEITLAQISPTGVSRRTTSWGPKSWLRLLCNVAMRMVIISVMSQLWDKMAWQYVLLDEC